MNSNKIIESFKIAFEDFLKEKGFKWCQGFFAGCSNDIFTRISLCYNMNDYKAIIDVRVLQMPMLCVSDNDIDSNALSGISINAVARTENKIIENEFDIRLTDIDEIMKSYCIIFTELFDKYFSLVTSADFPCKINILLKMSLGKVTDYQENSDLFGRLIGIDFLGLSYYLYINYNINVCKKFVMNVLNIYKTMLYEKLKQGNILDLIEKYSQKEKAMLETAFKQYDLLVLFAEALIENDKSYFASLDINYRQNSISRKRYIDNLLF